MATLKPETPFLRISATLPFIQGMIVHRPTESRPFERHTSPQATLHRDKSMLNRCKLQIQGYYVSPTEHEKTLGQQDYGCLRYRLLMSTESKREWKQTKS